MAFRISVEETVGLTTILLAGRLGDSEVVRVIDICEGIRQPLAVDLSHLMNASEAGVLLLRRLASEGARVLRASPYMKLLLADPPKAPRRTAGRRPLGARPSEGSPGTRSRRPPGA